MEDIKRVCKRCLIRETDQKELYHNMYTYISQLDEEIKTTKEFYEKRLEICKACKRLIEGICSACGCYVEMRAAIKVRRCPYEKW
ncbi:hypothetical protein CS063_13140 [Sporanaerobium hydrogeniformans]|uniref:Uncharacterized protein n=1 Tax=Sporanaerobium hydrogeniformans TaxID=3072179 RepID=A0AC61DAY6_9FIRM|nr:DUF6171 family protein [Sporanaerobium hydrogeniformans]PHV69923.1 hypothetical protein CS063_13140 [Sporanaerobium hydrogeniformans]